MKVCLLGFPSVHSMLVINMSMMREHLWWGDMLLVWSATAWLESKDANKIHLQRTRRNWLAKEGINMLIFLSHVKKNTSVKKEIKGSANFPMNCLTTKQNFSISISIHFSLASWCAYQWDHVSTSRLQRESNCSPWLKWVLTWKNAKFAAHVSPPPN